MHQPRPPSQHDLSVTTATGEQSLWQSLRGGKVSFGWRRLEPKLVWAIAAYTAWAGVLLNPLEPAVWLVTLYAAAIGLWCRMFPAHHQWLMLVRGIFLLCGAFMLQISAGTGGPTGPYFIWPVMVTAVYALLLAQRWAVLLVFLAVVQFAAACWLAGMVPSWRLAVAQAGMLWFFPFTAMMVGRSVRELDQQVEHSRLDRNTRLYNEAGFFSHGAELFDECRRRKRPFTMVLLNSADLREVSDLVGKPAANQLFAELVQNISAATPRDALAARTDAVEFGLALPGLTAERAAALLQQRLGEPPKVEMVLRGSKVTVMLDSVIAEATSDVPTLEDMYDRLHGKLLKRFGTELPVAPDQHTTLQGLLDKDTPVPHNARPTMPMSYGKAARKGQK